MTTIVNACSDLGVHVCGSEKGPIVLNKFEDRVNNVITVKKDNVKKEFEKGNKKKNIIPLNKFNKELYENIVSIKDFVITIGGDHSIAIASCLASKKKHDNLGIFWIDAHSDYHNMNSTITGNIHGMPFASVDGQNGTELTSFFDGNYFDPKKSVLIGGRDIEAPEFVNLKNAGVKIFTTEDIKKHGVKEIMKQAFEIVKDVDLHVSYDLDVIDPVVAPGVSIKAPDGINKEEAYEILDELIKNKDKIKSFDLVEFNPEQDIDKKTEEIATYILDKVIKEKD